MERTMSVEEKIKRAEEIYNRRRGHNENNYTTRVKVNEQKELSLFKRMICQIIICLLIYNGYYLIVNKNYVFSEDFIEKSKEILSYDIDFNKIYSSFISYIDKLNINIQKEENTQDSQVIQEEEKQDATKSDIEQVNNVENKDDKQNTTQEIDQSENIGGAEVTEQESEKNENNDTIKASTSNSNKEEDKSSETNQMEEDVKNIKSTISFIKPIEGKISSSFGWRNPTTTTVPKYHTGLDIAAVTGTVIKSATDGNVILASSEGDYRKSFKNN